MISIESGDIRKAIVGEIVYLSKYKTMLAKVLSCDYEKKVARIQMNDTGLEMEVSVNELGSTYTSQPERSLNTLVTILGTVYHILIVEEGSFSYDREADGWCDTISKEIQIFNFKQAYESVRDLVAYQKKVLRHEIIHAFLYESGLWQDSKESQSWALNEEMIDWMAIQLPKIQRAFEEAGCNE